MEFQEPTPNFTNSGWEIPTDILDDLCSRFIINVPEEERKDLVRLCFQIELAHWFFLDFYFRNTSKERKPCGIREFAHQIFKHIPYLQPFSNNVEAIIDEWKGYKLSVPTFGAILLDDNMTHVLLVQSYCSKSSWGFPKGKINKDEPPCQCAVREVYEETGFNIQGLIDPKEYIEAQVNEQLVRLYVVPGVSRDEVFAPKTRNEIKAVNWFSVTELPATKKDASMKLKLGLGAHSFFMVTPFVRRLRQWIFEHDKRSIKKYKRPRFKSCGDLDYYRYNPNSWSFGKNYQSSGQGQPISKERGILALPAQKEEVRILRKAKSEPVKSTSINHNENSSFVEVHSSASIADRRNESSLIPSQTRDRIESIPFKQITLSESFLKHGISSLTNFKLNIDALFA